MNDLTPLVVANFKANKTWQEISSWLEEVGPKSEKFKGTVIVAPSSPFLAAVQTKIQSSAWKIKLAVQDLSQFEQGPYTGETAASQIAPLCQYAIIGHSERRQNFKEDKEILEKKVQNAKSAGIESIFCIQEEFTPIPEGVNIVAYEPVFAIGTGNPDTPQNAKNLAEKIKQKREYTFIYGGSASAENVASFLEKDLIEGVLVGTKSLNPKDFISILENANL